MTTFTTQMNAEGNLICGPKLLHQEDQVNEPCVLGRKEKTPPSNTSVTI